MSQPSRSTIRIMKQIFLFACALLTCSTTSAQAFDYLIRGGKVVDGTGHPWYYADIGIRKGKIVAVGNLGGHKARHLIDATGLVVAPGFIDVHTHIERGIFAHPDAHNYVYDGVTTVVTGNCGGSATDVRAFFKKLKKTGISINVATLIGHNSVRRAVMGDANRRATPRELEQMQQLVARAMREGAVGLSTGLIYVPGTYAPTEEVVALARTAQQHGGLYASHIRHEDWRVFDAIAEAVHIGREAQIPVQISHFKISGKADWGASARMRDTIEAWRRRGVDVTVDQYPYTASSTSLDVLLPSWVFAGGRDSMVLRLADPEQRARIEREMEEMLARTGFDDYGYAVIARCPQHPEYAGKSIPEVTRLRGYPDDLAHQRQTIFELVPLGRVQMVYHKMSEEDVQRIMAWPLSMVASDAGLPTYGEGAPHPRNYGTCARVLGRYVRELGLLRLEEAIRKMTSMPAKRFGLLDRGVIRPNMAADLVVFSEREIIDKATFEKPHAYPAGIYFVFVNGEPVVENGRHTGRRPGKPLKRK